MKPPVPLPLAVTAGGQTGEALAQSAAVSPPAIDLALESGEVAVEAVSITIAPFCIRSIDVDVQASDPAAQVENLSGIIENGGGGNVSVFGVCFMGDGTARSFELQFVDAQTRGELAAIPETIESTGVPAPGPETSGERSTVLSCAYECRPAAFGQSWSGISTLQLNNPGSEAVSAGIAYFDGNQNLIARSRVELGGNDVDEIHVCRSLREGRVSPPRSGLAHVFLPRATSAVYGWMKDAIGSFPPDAAEPHAGWVSAISKTECRVIPPTINDAGAIGRQLERVGPPSVPALLINGTAER